VLERLHQYPDMTATSGPEFSLRTRRHWLMRTKAGIALGCTAVLGLLVGAVVASQALYAATVASQREYAVLRAADAGVPDRPGPRPAAAEDRPADAGVAGGDAVRRTTFDVPAVPLRPGRASHPPSHPFSSRPGQPRLSRPAE